VQIGIQPCDASCRFQPAHCGSLLALHQLAPAVEIGFGEQRLWFKGGDFPFALHNCESQFVDAGQLTTDFDQLFVLPVPLCS
jgi:hypothetical protein